MQHLWDLFGGRFHVLHGGARGADDQAWLAAQKLNITTIAERPDWKKHGNHAGLIRNIKMLEWPPQFVVALWDGMSRGTYHTIDHAVRVYRIPTIVFNASRS